MYNAYTIVGGGIAGLSAGARLLEHGINPLIIEAGDYTVDKVCGEFCSFKGLEQLNKWDIHPQVIEDVYFYAYDQVLHYRFPKPFGSMSHLGLVSKLLERNKNVLTNAQVIKWDVEASEHVLALSNGGQLTASNLICATGALVKKERVQPSYIGFKAHCTGISLNSLEMYVFEDGYLGITPIEGGMCNVAGLVRRKKWKSTEALIEQWKEESSAIKSRLPSGLQWLETSIPEFGLRMGLNAPNAYFIGDAAGGIPPITGNGLSLGIASGVSAADFSKNSDWCGFRANSKNTLSKPIFWGQILQKIAFNPSIARPLMRLGSRFPYMFHPLYYLTR
jgi:flavin-dependent dehydrogenase